jgi:dTDP-4-amino-4,6-dideoxygalactose transaminase
LIHGPRRQEYAERYDAAFQASGLVDGGFITLPKPVWKEEFIEYSSVSNPKTQPLNSHYHIYNQHVIATPYRDELKSYLMEKDIGTEIYYPVPLHIQECFTDLGYQPGSYLMSEEAAKRKQALPIYPELTLEQQNMWLILFVSFLFKYLH